MTSFTASWWASLRAPAPRCPRGGQPESPKGKEKDMGHLRKFMLNMLETMLETWNHQSNHDQWGVFKGIQYLTTNHGNTIVISWDMLSNEILNPHSESGNCFLFLLPSPDIVRKTWMLRLVIPQWIEMGGSNQKTWGLNQPLKKKL